MRVVGLVPERLTQLGACQYYRVVLPLNALSKHIDTAVFDVTDLERATDEFIGAADIYVMSRVHGPGQSEFLRRIHDLGGKFVFDLDDDLTEEYRLVDGRGAELRSVLASADAVSVGSTALVERIRQHTAAPIHVTRNYVNSAWLYNERHPHTTLQVGVSGSPTHYMDWYPVHVALSRLKNCTVLLHGDMPGYFTYFKSALRLPPCSFREYPRTLAQFDILCCAVDSRDRFNDGKTWLKALEAMAVGAVAVCSRNFAPYAALAALGAPVVLVDDDGWYDTLQGLIDAPESVWAAQRAGQAWVRERGDMYSTGWREWLKCYQTVASS